MLHLFLIHGAATPHHAGHCHLVSELLLIFHFLNCSIHQWPTFQHYFSTLPAIVRQFLLVSHLAKAATICLVLHSTWLLSPFSWVRLLQSSLLGVITIPPALAHWETQPIYQCECYWSALCCWIIALPSAFVSLLSTPSWPVSSLLLPEVLLSSFQVQNLCLSLEATVAFFHAILLVSVAMFHLQHTLLNSPLPLPSTSPMLTRWNHRPLFHVQRTVIWNILLSASS